MKCDHVVLGARREKSGSPHHAAAVGWWCSSTRRGRRAARGSRVRAPSFAPARHVGNCGIVQRRDGHVLRPFSLPDVQDNPSRSPGVSAPGPGREPVQCLARQPVHRPRVQGDRPQRLVERDRRRVPEADVEQRPPQGRGPRGRLRDRGVRRADLAGADGHVPGRTEEAPVNADR